jgi:hypothetical protein
MGDFGEQYIYAEITGLGHLLWRYLYPPKSAFCRANLPISSREAAPQQNTVRTISREVQRVRHGA